MLTNRVTLRPTPFTLSGIQSQSIYDASCDGEITHAQGLYLSVSFADMAFDKKPIGSNRSDISSPPPASVRTEPQALTVHG
jgi:hypothetical protein